MTRGLGLKKPCIYITLYYITLQTVCALAKWWQWSTFYYILPVERLFTCPAVISQHTGPQMPQYRLLWSKCSGEIVLCAHRSLLRGEREIVYNAASRHLTPHSVVGRKLSVSPKIDTDILNSFLAPFSTSRSWSSNFTPGINSCYLRSNMSSFYYFSISYPGKHVLQNT